MRERERKDYEKKIYENLVYYKYDNSDELKAWE